MLRFCPSDHFCLMRYGEYATDKSNPSLSYVQIEKCLKIVTHAVCRLHLTGGVGNLFKSRLYIIHLPDYDGTGDVAERHPCKAVLSDQSGCSSWYQQFVLNLSAYNSKPSITQQRSKLSIIEMNDRIYTRFKGCPAASPFHYDDIWPKGLQKQ